jgi:hypothetical protein
MALKKKAMAMKRRQPKTSLWQQTPTQVQTREAAFIKVIFQVMTRYLILKRCGKDLVARWTQGIGITSSRIWTQGLGLGRFDE